MKEIKIADIMLPPLFFMIFQLLMYIFYDGFEYKYTDTTFFLVVSLYIASIAAMLFFSFPEKKNIIKYSGKDRDIGLWDYFLLIIVLFFILKPTVFLYFMGKELGFDYVRDNYFSTSFIREKAYGSMFFAIMTQFYISVLIWFYLILIIDSKKKNFIFYIILISMVLYNLSFAGRFNMYIVLLILYYKTIIQGGRWYDYIKKYSPVFIIFLMLSFFTVLIRSFNDDVDDFLYLDELLVLFEYHVIPPFLMSQKIDTNILLNNGYPFSSVFEGFFAPFFYFLGSGFGGLPQGHISEIFSEFTLYSIRTDIYYNAYSTFYSLFYYDFGLMAPIFVFLFVFLVLSLNKIIIDSGIRVKYLIFISLMFYFGLFQNSILSYGVLLLLGCIFFYSIYKNLIHYIK